MKKLGYSLLSLALSTAPQAVHAQSVQEDISDLNKTLDSLTGIVFFLIDWTANIAGVIVVFMIVIGGIHYIQGNTDGGKKTITAAIIGAIIVLLAKFIIITLNSLVVS